MKLCILPAGNVVEQRLRRHPRRGQCTWYAEEYWALGALHVRVLSRRKSEYGYFHCTLSTAQKMNDRNRTSARSTACGWSQLKKIIGYDRTYWLQSYVAISCFFILESVPTGSRRARPSRRPASAAASWPSGPVSATVGGNRYWVANKDWGWI